MEPMQSSQTSQTSSPEHMSSLTFALQALLARHEAYMASAQRDRMELNARIAFLESENAALEARNANVVDENRALLDQLEQLNSSVADSEIKVRSLEAALQTAQQCVRRLEGATDRAEDMERHIAVLESEQAALQGTLSQSEEEVRSAVYRWKQAERGIGDLQQQLDRLEKEAREERERHVEAIGRVERQRAVEKDLHTAAGRLKGAAAARSLNGNKDGSSVVSHFVRDLLQDNANLQLGMAELREMLANSHDEIQMLREHVLYHQPVEDGASSSSTLRAELGPPEQAAVQNVSQELHVHHHYHVAQNTQSKKPKKRRQALTPAIFTPPSMSSPSTPPRSPWRLNRSCPASTVLSHSAKPSSTSTISLPSNRWSLLSDQPSDFAPSSVPSTPQSNVGNAMFDHGVSDMSLPTSPTTSADPTSPCFRSAYGKPGVQYPTANFSISHAFSDDTSPLHQETEQSQILSTSLQDSVTNAHKEESQPSQDSNISSTEDGSFRTALATTPTDDSTIVISNEEAAPEGGSFSDATSSESEFESECESEPEREPEPEPERFDPGVVQLPKSLRRAVSHESIMSLSNGLDIHTLRSRPAQLALRPLVASTAGTGFSPVTAKPTISRGGGEGKRGSVILRDNLALTSSGLLVPRTGAGSRAVWDNPSRGSIRRPSPSPRIASSGTRALGKLVSWRPWGGGGNLSQASTAEEPASPTEASDPPSSGTPIPKPSSPSQTLSRPEGTTQLLRSPSPSNMLSSPRERDFFSRAPGINQPGAIPGFYEYWAAHQRRGPPSKVCPDIVDTEALRDGLEGL